MARSSVTWCPRWARGDVGGGAGQVHGDKGSPMQLGEGEAEEGSGWRCFRSSTALRCISLAAAWSWSTWERAGGEARSKEEGRWRCGEAHRGRGKAATAAAPNAAATTVAPVVGRGQEDQGGSVGCVQSLARGKGGEREKLDEGGVGGLLRRGGIGEKQWGGGGCLGRWPRGGKGGGG
jgi:hypothetical protein